MKYWAFAFSIRGFQLSSIEINILDRNSERKMNMKRGLGIQIELAKKGYIICRRERVEEYNLDCLHTLFSDMK